MSARRYAFNARLTSAIRFMLQCHEREARTRADQVPAPSAAFDSDTLQRALACDVARTDAAILEVTDLLYDAICSDGVSPYDSSVVRNFLREWDEANAAAVNAVRNAVGGGDDEALFL